MNRIIFFLLAVSVVHLVSGQIPSTERQALLDLFTATNGHNWYNHKKWDTTLTADQWGGVTIDENHVTELELSNLGLVGQLPASLIQLDSLHLLNLSNNTIKGQIPDTLYYLGKLEELNLFSCDSISGIISPAIAHASSLKVLNLSSNAISGTLPEELISLTQLEKLYLSNCDLQGALPAEIGQLQQIIEINLSRNELEGALPTELGNLQNLQFLNLSSNNFSGTLPPQLGNLADLYYLSLSQNELEGSIPTEFWNLEALVSLSLSSNNLDGSLDSLVAQLINLQNLDIQNNNFSGQLPKELSTLPLTSISVGHNLFQGPLPAAFDQFTTLSFADFSNNYFIGPLPDLTSNQNLTTLWLNRNHFQFGDFEPYMGQFPHPSLSLSISDQYNVGSPLDTAIADGGPLTLYVPFTGSYNHYQWYKGISPISGATQSTLMISSSTFSDGGFYHVRVTNDSVPITLKSHNLKVNIVPRCPQLTDTLPDINPDNSVEISWSHVPGADFYYVRAGTSNGLWNIAYNQPVYYPDSATSLQNMAPDELTYVKISPRGSQGFNWNCPVQTISAEGLITAMHDLDQHAVRAYPNPSARCFELNGVRDLQVFDTYGQQVLHDPLPTIFGCDLPRGTYFLTGSVQGKLWTQLIIKE